MTHRHDRNRTGWRCTCGYQGDSEYDLSEHLTFFMLRDIGEDE